MTECLPPAIFLMGPTASGKTDLALALADALPCELISVDSALIYRGMDIGTAKPDKATLARYPHRLVDIRDPAESYSAAEFRADALAAMAEITARGRIPLLVGGTMLYYKALLEGLADMPGADPTVRAELEAWAAVEGWEALHRELARVDPESAARIHPNDPQRLVRALEVYRVSGLSMTAHRQRQMAQNGGLQAPGVGQLPYTVTQFAIARPTSRRGCGPNCSSRTRRRRSVLLHSDAVAIHPVVQGPGHAGQPAGVLQGPAGRTLRIQPGGVPSALLHQHLATMETGAAVPFCGAQR